MFMRKGGRKSEKGKKKKKNNKTLPDLTRSMCVGVWWAGREPVI